jgi:hypothetical protein
MAGRFHFQFQCLIGGFNKIKNQHFVGNKTKTMNEAA